MAVAGGCKLSLFRYLIINHHSESLAKGTSEAYRGGNMKGVCEYVLKLDPDMISDVVRDVINWEDAVLGRG